MNTFWFLVLNLQQRTPNLFYKKETHFQALELQNASLKS